MGASPLGLIRRAAPGPRGWTPVLQTPSLPTPGKNLAGAHALTNKRRSDVHFYLFNYRAADFND